MYKQVRKIILLFLVIVFFFCCFPSASFATVDYLIQDDFPKSDLQTEEIPPYTDELDYFIEINDGKPGFTIWLNTTTPFVLFSPLDYLERPGPAYACLGPETLPTEARKPMGPFYPAGWQSTRYDDLIDGGSLYNRSHLIGYLLCGDNGTPENLFTGTRNLNAGSMLLVEKAVEMYIEETGHHVLYRITPFYHGDDLVPFGVQIEAQNVETDEDGFCCNLFLYNVQPGITIDYTTGENWKDGEFFSLDTQEFSEDDFIRIVPADPEPPIPSPAGEPDIITYVLNKNTMKFHYLDCRSVADIKPKNRLDVDWSRDEIIAAGYSPCGRCHP